MACYNLRQNNRHILFLVKEMIHFLIGFCAAETDYVVKAH